MEGLGGVVRPSQVDSNAPEFALTRQWAMQEILAVIAGAKQGGATEFWVKDAHGSGLNLQWDLIPDGVRFVCGQTGRTRFPGLDESCAALFLVGYHAMAGTPNAILDHTWSSVSKTRFFLNQREVGEIAVDAAIAGAFGVPCVLVSGDNKTAAEAMETLGTVETVVVKEAVTARGAICYSQVEVLRRLQAGAHVAMQRLRADAFTPYRPALPLHYRIAWTNEAGNAESKETQGNDVRAVIAELLGQS